MKKLFFLFFCQIVFSHSFSQTESENDFENLTCGGVERWTIKVLTDAQASAINYFPVNTTIAALTSIATPNPPNPNATRISGIEYQTYSVTCKISIKKEEDDNDYHLVLKDGNKTLIGEVPDPSCYAAGLSVHKNEYIAARNFVNSHIASGNVNNVNIPDVVVTGVAFVDPPHGQTGAAPNNLELHPILDIHFVPAAGNQEQGEKILNVNVFPNPSSETTVINVESKTNDLLNCTFKLFDLTGKLLQEVQLPVSGGRKINYNFDSGSTEPGLYFYRITNSGFTLFEGKIEIN